MTTAPETARAAARGTTYDTTAAGLVAGLADALRSRGVSDVDDSTLTRTLYAADASLYRVVPQVVARPRHVDEIDAVLDAARATGVPVTMRGAGTSIAGNAVGPGIVVDTARHLHRILELDPEARTARVEPGVVHARLQAQAHGHGLRFGPDPSTHTRCTIGGMIGNNACGSRALGYGRTSDNVVGLDLLTGTGERVRVHGGEPGGSRVERDLAAIVDADLAHVRQRFGTFSRQVSGYALEQLLPERGRRLDRLVTGSEGTLALVREATVSLVRDHPERLLLVLGYASMAEAADAVPTLLELGAARGAGVGDGDPARLVACEGLDSRIVDLVRVRRGGVPELPSGAGWLFAEVAGEGAADLVVRLRDAAGALGDRLVTDPGETAALWRIREDGAGLAARSLTRPAHAGWEDAAVPPVHLGAWLRDFDALLTEHGLDGVPYGHFGDGCVHVRIDFAFDDGGASFREFLTASATALAAYGGSLSGEHGDGRARSALLPLMYDERSLELFGAVKHACDPDDLLNPGVLVDPRPAEADLRPVRPRRAVNPGLRLLHDEGDLATAVHRCTGVGKCVAANASGVMCPSWQATRDEKDSTRGRARVLQEALDAGGGAMLAGGLADPAVHEALDLCLSCKGCASDCPTGVDMATYKSEALHQTYAGRRRPLTHYTLGRLPTWLGLVGRVGPAVPAINRLAAWGPTARLATAAAGVDPRRSLPSIARRTLRRTARAVPGRTGTPDVWIWADSFTDSLSPHTAEALIALLGAAGLRAEVIDEPACCGLTWVTTGQLDAARRIVGRTVSTLAAYVDSGAPVVGLEPSCLTTLRSDAVELSDDPAAVRVAAGMRTPAELLSDLAERGLWTPPDLDGVDVLVQPHCHQASILGFEADRALLERAGARVTVVGGCCGLAGNFGMEQGHYEVSVAVAETHLLPAVRARGNAVVLADGVSCRVQLADLEDLRALHLVELLAFGVPETQTVGG